MNGLKKERAQINALQKIIIFLMMITISLNVYAERHRSQKAKSIFKSTHYCPSTGRPKGSCPGYIIDHINPLACGGADSPDNMQWQTKQEAKAKDKWERKGC